MPWKPSWFHHAGQPFPSDEIKYTSLYYETSSGVPSPEVSTSEALALIQRRALRGGTKVWTDGMHDWLPLHKCHTLFVGLEELELDATVTMLHYEESPNNPVRAAPFRPPMTSPARPSASRGQLHSEGRRAKCS